VLGRRLAQLAEQLASEGSTTIHGDFHLGQVLIAEGRTVLVDLDRADAGAPALDVGTLRAHLVEVGGTPALDAAFLAGYAESTSATIGKRSLDAATVIGLFRRAVLPFRRLEADWPTSVLRRVEDVERRLEELD
jgi:Ser/Thr protein kinase RdoA (MazF antagonist)